MFLSYAKAAQPEEVEQPSAASEGRDWDKEVQYVGNSSR